MFEMVIMNFPLFFFTFFSLFMFGQTDVLCGFKT
jgi:hypothetical protein